MKRLFLTLSLLLGLSIFPSSAQFILDGDDPSRIRWSQARWDSYRLIYPRGLDSLANVYGRLLEEYRIPVSRSTGVVPVTGYRRRLPVLLHTTGGESNGMVAWAPKRVEFHTLPMPYQTWTIPWDKSLAIHESRHISQMSVGYQGLLKPLKWITGDALPLAVTAVYTPDYLLEGDAVVAETALTEGGRGRDGDFLNYYQSAFDSGNYRTWEAWRRGSWRRYTPNHYALGYLMIAGTRVFYDDPMYMGNIYSRITRGNLLHFASSKYETKVASGKKFNEAWPEIMEGFRKVWNDNAEARGPFTRSEFVTAVPSWYESYAHGTAAGESALAVRSGLLRPARLVSLDTAGKVTDLRSFAASTSNLAYDSTTGRLYWSEDRNSPRWANAAVSRIRYIDLRSGSLKAVNLTREGRLYNPAPSPDGKRIAAVDYPYEGGTALVILDAETGREISRNVAPAGLQLTIPAWYRTSSGGLAIAVAGLSDDGMGIYSSNGFSPILSPVQAKIGDLRYHGSGLIFSSDRTGVNEIYQLSGDDVLQLTATRYGAYSGFFRGDSLYYVTRETGIERERGRYGEGELLHKASSSDLLYRKVDFSDIYRDPVAQALSRQEQALAAGTMALTTASEPVSVRNYGKLPNLVRFHTWVPLNVQINSLSSINFDQITQTAGVGATAFFQNDLGTASGFVSYGYKLRPLEQEGVWKNTHNAHLAFTYTGLYPAFELLVDYGDRPGINYYRLQDTYGKTAYWRVRYMYSDRPSVNASLKAYVPLRFNSGGKLRGITPLVKYEVTNDMYRRAIVEYDHGTALEGTPYDYSAFAGATDGETVRMHTISASVTGYVMQPSAKALEYPRLGIGMQAGYHQRIGLADLYSAGVYGYLYGYVPGFARTHGVKLTATAQHTFNALYSESTVTVRPRGFVRSEVDRYMTLNSSDQFMLTADYALQFGLPHRQPLSKLFHFTHIVATPHFDAAIFPYHSNDRGILGSLYTAGADITLRMANILCFPVAARIGVTVNYNGGPSYNRIAGEEFSISRNYVGFIFDFNI